MARPDFTDKYNTKLSSEEESAFQDWANKNNRQKDLYDYDMRGWWKSDGPQNGRGHFSDQWKKPNHPTFSTDSEYNGTDGYKGGVWGKKDKKDTFSASKSNLSNMSADELKAYFASVEPDAELDLPQSKAQKRYGPK